MQHKITCIMHRLKQHTIQKSCHMIQLLVQRLSGIVYVKENKNIKKN